MSAPAGSIRRRANGKRSRRSHGIARNDGEGTCCCGSDNCSDCPATDLGCEWCLDDFLPARWHVTYLGVEIDMPCTDCSANPDTPYTFLSFGFLGTYTLDGRDAFDGCLWSGASGSLLAAGDSDLGGCSGYGVPTGVAGCPTAYFGYGAGYTDEGGTMHPFFCGPPYGPYHADGSDLSVVTKGDGVITLVALALDGGGVGIAGDGSFNGYSGTFFQGTVEATSCCRDYVFDNENTEYACPTTFDTDLGGRTYSGIFGINGTAHLSLC